MQLQDRFELGLQKMRPIRQTAIAVALMFGALSAQASPVTGSLSFSAFGFPTGAPNDPVTGAVHYSFDNSAQFLSKPDGAFVNGVTIDIDLLELSLPGPWGPLVMTYLIAIDVLAIGQGPFTTIAAGTQDFLFVIDKVSTDPHFREFAYASAAIASSDFRTRTGSVAEVPEPASLAIAAVGLVAICGLRRRRPTGSGPKLLRS